MLAFYFMAVLNKFILVECVMDKDFISSLQVWGRNSAHERFFLPFIVVSIELMCYQKGILLENKLEKN